MSREPGEHAGQACGMLRNGEGRILGAQRGRNFRKRVGGGASVLPLKETGRDTLAARRPRSRPSSEVEPLVGEPGRRLSPEGAEESSLRPGAPARVPTRGAARRALAFGPVCKPRAASQLGVPGQERQGPLGLARVRLRLCFPDTRGRIRREFENLGNPKCPQNRERAQPRLEGIYVSV